MRVDESFVERVEALMRSTEQLNGVQYIGHDSLEMKVSSTAAVYDFSLSGTYQYRRFEFVADIQEGVSGTLRFSVSKTPGGSPASNSDVRVFTDELGIRGGSKRLEFETNIYNNSGTTLYFKVYVVATDTGTVGLL